MKKWLLLLLLASPTVVRAELVQPNFTQGSMNSTTTTTQDITEEITTTTYGAKISRKQLEEIAENKMSDLNAHTIDDACKILAGTARSMGVEVME